MPHYRIYFIQSISDNLSNVSDAHHYRSIVLLTMFNLHHSILYHKSRCTDAIYIYVLYNSDSYREYTEQQNCA